MNKGELTLKSKNQIYEKQSKQQRQRISTGRV